MQFLSTYLAASRCEQHEGRDLDARDDARMSRSIPKRDRSTGVKPWLVDPRAKSNFERRGGPSYTSNLRFLGKNWLIWSKPAQIWSVPMSNVSMTNADSGSSWGEYKYSWFRRYKSLVTFKNELNSSNLS